MKTIAAYLVLVFYASTALSESISENLAWNKEFSEKNTYYWEFLENGYLFNDKNNTFIKKVSDYLIYCVVYDIEKADFKCYAKLKINNKYTFFKYSNFKDIKSFEMDLLIKWHSDILFS